MNGRTWQRTQRYSTLTGRQLERNAFETVLSPQLLVTVANGDERGWIAILALIDARRCKATRGIVDEPLC